jgi:hypothetical protein
MKYGAPLAVRYTRGDAQKKAAGEILVCNYANKKTLRWPKKTA